MIWRNARAILPRWLAAAALSVMLAAAHAETPSNSECPPRIIAAFDIGSGTTRMQVANVAECLDGAPQTLVRREIPLGFSADLAEREDSAFSETMLRRADLALANLIESARSAGAEELVGVATAAFRRAENAAGLVADWRARFELDLNIIGQDEEGRLAYRMIELTLKPERPLVVWDIGAGSQQLVWRNPGSRSFEHFNSKLAAVSFRNLSLTELARPEGAISPNPITADEARRLQVMLQTRLAAEVPVELVDLIRGGAWVVGVGGVHGASLVGQAGLQPGETLTRELLSELLETRLGLDDAAVGGEYADTQVTNLILVLELMKAYGIESYRATRADLTDALLVETVGRGSPSGLQLSR